MTLHSSARVITEISEYYLLVGKLIELSPLGGAGVVEFPDSELARAAHPERAKKRRVYFYWRNLQEVIYDA